MPRTPIAKYAFLRALQDRQEILFCALLEAHLHEMLPIVYTPTVGEAVQRFSELFAESRGLCLSVNTIDRAGDLVANYPEDDVRMIVATDSSAILGIGNQGYGGIGIAIGKLALYTVGGGLSPFQSVPVGLDVGTDRADLLADARYLGVPHARLKGDAYFAFMDTFVNAVRARWPRAVVQWEDFAKDAAFAVKERYRSVLPSFNDDIQGTGAVALAGLVNACRLRGERLRDQNVVVHGAGAGGVGVATAIRSGMEREGLSPSEAHARIFVLDSRGLLTRDRDLEPYKRAFAQETGRIAGTNGKAPGLHETIRGARATILVGLLGQAGAFDEASIRAVAANTERPIVFPLSNPTSSIEVEPAKVLEWTGARDRRDRQPVRPRRLRRAIDRHRPGNNAFIFPGLGLGAILSEATAITDAMVLEASYALSEYTAEKHADSVYPPVGELQIVSRRVASRVIQRASQDGVARIAPLSKDAIDALVDARFWHAHY